VLHDGLEEAVHAVPGILVEVAYHPAVQPRSVEHGEIRLLVRGAQFEKEVEGAAEGVVGGGVGAVHLVHDDQGAVTEGERPHEHVAGLGHGAFAGVDQKEHRIHHGEDPLHLAGEIRVSRRVHDVDPVVLPFHGAVFGADGDTPFPFQVARIHEALGDAGVVPEDVGGAEDAVDEGGLAVVDVGHDGYIADAFRPGKCRIHGSSCLSSLS
jgi:hypothetical protein